MSQLDSHRRSFVRAGSRVLFAASLGLSLGSTAAAQPSTVVRVGCKNFTEQEILGELVAQLIERHTDLTVELRLWRIRRRGAKGP